MNWVENGTAPDSIIATKYANDTEHSVVSRQRPLCPYPKQAQYKGIGDPNAPDSWECRLPYDSPPDKPAPAQVSAGSLCFYISDLMTVVAVLVVSGWMVITSR
jgi:feruloyl esterase